jgi:hypothetical protein
VEAIRVQSTHRQGAESAKKSRLNRRGAEDAESFFNSESDDPGSVMLWLIADR